MLLTKDTYFGAFLTGDVLGDWAAVRGLEDSSASGAPLVLKDKRSRTRFRGGGAVGWLHRISPGLKKEGGSIQFISIRKEEDIFGPQLFLGMKIHLAAVSFRPIGRNSREQG